ncbi:neuronal acetylcholine receptor subunit alpha-10-like, partial [Oculina patagonica]
AWFNPYLKWNSSNFGGIKAINVHASKVWKPDIFLYNNVDDSDDGALDRFKTKVQITSDGKLNWMAPKIVQSSCKFDVTYFPFDKQICRMKFGSWTYDGFRLDLVPESDSCEGDIKKFIRHGEWDLISMPCSRNEVIYKCCPEPYPDITYTMDLRRRHMFYFINMIAPCFLISALTLLSFYLPPESGERLTLVITNLLALTVFMLLVVEIIPATSETVPLISVYFYGSVFEVALALVATCLVLRCYFNNPSHTPVPNWVRHIVLGWMARLTKVPVKKILHGIDPKESLRRAQSTDENENLSPEPIVHKKIPNTTRNQMSSSQQLHLKHTSPNLPGDIQPRLNLLPAIQRVRNTTHRLSMPPVYDNIQIGGAMNDLITSRAASRINLAEHDSQPVLNNVRSSDDVTTGTDHVTRTLLESQAALSKDVAEMVRYIQDQEMGDLMKEEWQLIAAIIDKFFLWMFLIILCVSTVVIFMQAPSYAWS